PKYYLVPTLNLNLKLIDSKLNVEWYGYRFPELIKIVTDNSTYCKMTQLIGNRKELSEESPESLEEVASRSSMGMDISPIDLINIERFSNRVVSLASYRLELQEYLRSEMSQVAPNLAALIGDVVGARLISHAGSLAKYPASTVQILGTEKALFRALKTRGNTPKYGLIFHSTFIGRAAAKNKWRVSRYLANKCTIASRINTFSEEPTCVFGDKLRDLVEERLSFYETGEAPRKNLDVMKRGCDTGEVAAEIKIRLEKREKKHRKWEKKQAALSTGDEEGECDVAVVKKHAAEEAVQMKEEAPATENGDPIAKKKRKSEAIEVVAEEALETPQTEKKKL
uniref:Nucleolar protein 56 n=1 Tax=Oncorhynchus mykiss TaxID=8022 RepID=A0A8C7PC99_ONCMY